MFKSTSDEPRPARIIALSAALMFFYGFFLGGIQYVIADVADAFHADPGSMGMLVSAQYMPVVIMPVLMGALADRIGKRPVLAAFSLLFGIGSLTAGASHSVAAYVAGVLLTGAGYSVCESVSCAAMSDLNPAKAARWIALTQGVLCAGAVLSPLLVRAMIGALGASWRIVFQICAGAFLLLALPVAMTRFPAPAAAPAERRARVGMLFASSVFVCLFAAILLYVGLENGFGYFVESLFAQRLRESSGAFAISLYWVGMAVSRFVFSLRTCESRRMLTVCFALAALLFILLATIRTNWLALALCALIGAAYGPIWSTLVAEAAACFPGHSGSATGAMSAGCGMGGILYPILMGFTAQYFNLQAAFVMLAVTAVAGAALCLRLPKKNG